MDEVLDGSRTRIGGKMDMGMGMGEWEDGSVRHFNRRLVRGEEKIYLA